MDNSATGETMQDVTSRLETSLYEVQDTEPEKINDDVVSNDVARLPEDDDTDSIDDEGSVDLEKTEAEDDATLATYLGIDDDRIVVEEDGTVQFKAIIDGESKLIPLKELASSYQMQGHVNNKSMALEEERKNFEATRSNATAEIKQRAEGIHALTRVVEKELVAEYESIDWARLREEDPSEWSALRQDYSDRARKVQQMQALAHEEGQRIAKEEAQNSEFHRQEYLKAEYSKMLSINPSWQNPEVLKKDMSGLRSFAMSEYSFTEDDLDTVVDHRIIKMLQDAKSFSDNAQSGQVKREKIVPKFQKPGAVKGNAKQLASARKVKAQRGKVRSSGGSIESVADLLMDRM